MTHATDGTRLHWTSLDVDAATFAATTARLQAWDAPAWEIEHREEGASGASFDVAVAHRGTPCIVRCRSRVGRPVRAAVLVQDANEHGSRWHADVIRSTATRLGWCDDLADFWACVADDPVLDAALVGVRHLRLVRHTTAFEALAWALIRQRTPHRFAVDSLRRLQRNLGRTVETESRIWTTFPSAHDVARADARAAILDATRNVRKTDRLHAAAAEFAALDPRALATGPLGDVRRTVSRLPGVGPWTVDYVLLMGLGRLDHLPWTDTGLADAISSVYVGGWHLEAGDLRRLAAPYAAIGGMWAHLVKRAHHGMRGY